LLFKEKEKSIRQQKEAGDGSGNMEGKRISIYRLGKGFGGDSHHLSNKQRKKSYEPLKRKEKRNVEVGPKRGKVRVIAPEKAGEGA